MEGELYHNGQPFLNHDSRVEQAYNDSYNSLNLDVDAERKRKQRNENRRKHYQKHKSKKVRAEKAAEERDKLQAELLSLRKQLIASKSKTKTGITAAQIGKTLGLKNIHCKTKGKKTRCIGKKA